MILGDIINKIKSIKGIGILTAVFFIGIILIIFSGSTKGKHELQKSEFDEREYVTATEEKLKDMISGITGSGSVKVMVTLENSTEQYYERDTKVRESTSESNKSYESDTSLVFEDKKPILVKEIFPKIKGVAVVCDGAQNTQVQQKVINLVACALDITTNRIYVTK